MTQLATTLKAFGEDTRLRILRLLSMQELSVTELVETMDLSQPRVSRHLAVLRQAGLVADRREGNWVYYRLAGAQPGGVAADVWRAIAAGCTSDAFFGGDLGRLRRVLARRKARTKAYFDVVVSEWDRIKRDYVQDALPFLVVANLIGPESVAVDVGTGTGDVLVALAGSAARVIGVDSSEKMLSACRARVEQAGLHNVELRLGDAERLPLADGECDTAFASMVLHHLASPAAGVVEMARVVRPGGKVVLIDLIQHEHAWAREVMADVWLGFTAEQVEAWLTAAGLTDVTYSTSVIDSPLEGERPEKLATFIAVGTRPQGQRPMTNDE